MKTDTKIDLPVKECLINLLDYCKQNNWSGYDPYDGLNSPLFRKIPFFQNRISRLIFIQGFKRFPINLRSFFFIPKKENPKAIALFLMAFIKLSKLGLLEQEELIEMMIGKLKVLRSPNISYWCWGYSFPWQTRTILVPDMAPNLVCTSFVANALLDAYEKDPKTQYLKMAKSAGEYILDQLYWKDGDAVAGFFYPVPLLRNRVHNANFLGAALLSRLYRLSGDKDFLEPAMKVARYSANMQNENGSWNYGEGAVQQWIDNFHTGYNLCALKSIQQNINISEFDAHISRGFEFYKNHFFRDDGISKYYHNRTFPIDIHSVAQSIITFLTFRDIDENNLIKAHSVFKWAMNNMLNCDGHFYYQKHLRYTIKIPYMRWSQAWMVLALSTLLEGDDPGVSNV